MATIKLSREQRDAIYAEVTLDLDGVGDLAIAMKKADYATARRYRQRFEDDMRLLDDLGWEPEQNRDEFELTMPTADLARVIGYFNRLLGSSVEAHLAEPEEARRHAAQAVAVQTTLASVLAQAAQSDGS
jgi:hypothetical protein